MHISQPHYVRLMELRVNQAMKDTPIVLLSGPRQAGKTTLARQMALDKGLKYITLDDTLALQSARLDPVGGVEGFEWCCD